ncbi:MAG: hypothetical protein QF654_07885 [Alphaproteobacteria bacterium]|jgi:hypothetical protein|nr:hypothetical protein [Alphaproteobacteria bacterium]
MALIGKGVMAFWHDIAEDTEADFLHWHTYEHMPERVGIPGFRRGRRYVAVGSGPKYFTFYETESLATLTSKAYLDRLDDPTPWTQRSVSNFRNSTRTLCTVLASYGHGEGAAMLTVRFSSAEGEDEALRGRLADTLFPELARRPGLIGAHLIRGDEAASRTETGEKALRATPDEVADWVAMIEAIEPELLADLRRAELSDDSLAAQGATDLAAGVYRLHCALGEDELRAAGRIA